MSRDTYRFTKPLWDYRFAVIAGEIPWGVPQKILEVDRGTKKVIRETAHDEATWMRRWLFHTWPLDVWLVTALPTGDYVGSYEVHAELHSIEKTKAWRDRRYAKLKEQRPALRAW